MSLPADVRARFEYHPANPVTGQLHDQARQVVIDAADQLCELIPFAAPRERALALTHLEEALMWANKAIAVHGPKDAS